jgi:hypothetical protein
MKLEFREIGWDGWDGVDGIHLAQDRDKLHAIVNTVMKFRVRYNADIFLISYEIISFCRRSLLHQLGTNAEQKILNVQKL